MERNYAHQSVRHQRAVVDGGPISAAIPSNLRSARDLGSARSATRLPGRDASGGRRRAEEAEPGRGGSNNLEQYFDSAMSSAPNRLGGSSEAQAGSSRSRVAASGGSSGTSTSTSVARREPIRLPSSGTRAPLSENPRSRSSREPAGSGAFGDGANIHSLGIGSGAGGPRARSSGSSSSSAAAAAAEASRRTGPIIRSSSSPSSIAPAAGGVPSHRGPSSRQQLGRRLVPEPRGTHRAPPASSAAARTARGSAAASRAAAAAAEAPAPSVRPNQGLSSRNRADDSMMRALEDQSQRRMAERGQRQQRQQVPEATSSSENSPVAPGRYSSLLGAATEAPDAEEVRMLARALEESRRQLRLPGHGGEHPGRASAMGGGDADPDPDAELQRAIEASREQALADNAARRAANAPPRLGIGLTREEEELALAIEESTREQLRGPRGEQRLEGGRGADDADLERAIRDSTRTSRRQQRQQQEEEVARGGTGDISRVSGGLGGMAGLGLGEEDEALALAVEQSLALSATGASAPPPRAAASAARAHAALAPAPAPAPAAREAPVERRRPSGHRSWDTFMEELDAREAELALDGATAGGMAAAFRGLQGDLSEEDAIEAALQASRLQVEQHAALRQAELSSGGRRGSSSRRPERAAAAAAGGGAPERRRRRDETRDPRSAVGASAPQSPQAALAAVQQSLLRTALMAEAAAATAGGPSDDTRERSRSDAAVSAAVSAEATVLRSEQDAAYEASLAADRGREDALRRAREEAVAAEEEKKRLEEEAANEAEAEEKRKADEEAAARVKLGRLREVLQARLPPEPPAADGGAGAGGGCCELALDAAPLVGDSDFPRLLRRFPSDCSASAVYDFVRSAVIEECLKREGDLSPQVVEAARAGSFSLVQNFAPAPLPEDGTSLRAFGVGRRDKFIARPSAS